MYGFCAIMNHTSFLFLAGGSSSPTDPLCLAEPLGSVLTVAPVQDVLPSTFSLPRCSSELSTLNLGISKVMFESLLGESTCRVVPLACWRLDRTVFTLLKASCGERVCHEVYSFNVDFSLEHLS